jgi:uncharacterized protein (TIGR02266 family)
MQKRTPVTLKIKFKSETLEQFIERYAVDVSQGGIFIRTKEPLAVGTQMKFEFQLRDASPLIAGEGTVVWTRENDPSRPAIAPGMGVRFDRLADGSQTVLERILAEKAKQAPVRPAESSGKTPLFTDTPTRVAPAPVTEALLGEQRKKGDSFNEHTPLPKPMPFHSDADEFPEEAFEEATKVRALDELVAQTAHESGIADELAARRGGVRHDSTLADPPTAVRDRDSAPGLPNPPETRPAPKLLDTTPSPRTEQPTQVERPSDLGAAKTRLGLEPARSTSPPPLRGRASTPPAGVGSMGSQPSLSYPAVPPIVAPQQTERVAPPKKPSSAPIVIGILVAVAAIGAALWFLVLREDDTGGGTPKKGSNVVDKGSNGSAGPATPGSNSGGSAVVMNGSDTKGSNTPPPPPANLVDTVVGTQPDKADIEIVGTDQKGAAPLTAKLEKGKAYKAKISAPGFATKEIDVTGGGDKQVVKLDPKPRTISVTSEPANAAIYIDGSPTGHNTPFDLELTKAQAAKPKVKVSLRRGGFRPYDEIIDTGKFVEDADKMIAKVEKKLDRAPVIVDTTPKGSGEKGSAANGSGDKGSAEKGSADGGSAQAPTPPSGSGGGGGSSASGEPEPDWSKRP